MTVTTLEKERFYDDEQFSAVEIFQSDRMKVVCGFFGPGQFIPVHAPSSDLAIHVQSGSGIVRNGAEDYSVKPGDIVVIEADTERGIKANRDSRLEALLVTAPPPTDAEHEPVRKGIKQNEFEPQNR